MRRAAFIWSFLLVSFLSVQEIQAQDDVRITADFKEQNLSDVFGQISDIYPVKFAFDSRSLSVILVNDSFKESPIEQVLNELLADSGYSWKLLGETYVVYPIPAGSEESNQEAQRRRFTLSLSIVDQSSGEHLPFASASIRSGKVFSADGEGQLTIENFESDTSRLVVSYIGYETRAIQFSPEWISESRPIELSQNRSILPIAAIYGEPSRMVKVEKWAGRNTLNVQTLRKLPNIGGYDATRSIQMLPGVVGTNESSAAFQVKGGMSDQNLVTFDDFTLYHLDHFYGIFSAFNGNSIKNIRVHRGWFPASFGGRTASLVQITGKEGDRDLTRVTADLNFFSANLLLESPLYEDKVKFVLAGRRSFTDLIQSPAYQSMFNGLYNESITQPGGTAVNPFDGGNDPKFHFYDVTSKLSFRPRQGELVQLSFYSGRDDLELSYPISFQNGANIVFQDESQWGNVGGSFRWNKKWNDRNHTSLIASHSVYKSRLNALDQIDNLEQFTVDSVFSNQLMRLEESALKLESRMYVQDQKITMGVKLTGNDIGLTDEDSEGLSTTRSERTLSTSVYAQDELDLNDDVKANIGVRFTHYGGTRVVYFEPRLAVDWLMSEHFSVKANYGQFAQTIRRVRSQSLFLNSPDLWRLSGFGEVPVLKTKYVSLGGIVSTDWLDIDIETYFRSSTGLIIDPGEHQVIIENAYDNFWTGRGETFGADLMLQKTTGSHSGWVTFSAARGTMHIDSLDYTAPTSGINSYESKMVYMFKKPKWNIATTFIYGSGKPYTPVLGTFNVEHVNGSNQTYPSVGQINSAWLPAYHRLDVSFTYSFKLAMSNADISLAVFNVYNQDNIQQRQYFVLPSSDGEIGTRDVAMMGLLPTLQFRITY